MKKALKIALVLVLTCVVVLFAAPFIFKDKIKGLVVDTINKNIDASVSYDDVDLSLLKSFPQATVSIQNLAVVNKAPFLGDTLFYAQDLLLHMNVKELFKDKGEPINIQSFSASHSLVNIIFNEQGLGNFDIALKDDKKDNDDQSDDPMSFGIDSYEINDLKFKFTDQKSKMKLVLDSINHKGNGTYAGSLLNLDTKTNSVLSFAMDSVQYMKSTPISLDALLSIDLEKQKYTFKENKAVINQLPLEFDGFLQLLEKGQLYDLTFKTPSSSFANFLALMPKEYTGAIKDVKTSGDFTVAGKVKGTLVEEQIPTFSLLMKSDNASFKYPDLPKSVQNIHIDVAVENATGVLNDTYVDVNKLSFQIDQDQFNAAAKIKNIIVNPEVSANANGTINLANVTKVYPVKTDIALSGVLKANLKTAFDMKTIESGQYQKMTNSGTASLTGFHYNGSEMANPVLIQNAALTFNPSNIVLNDFLLKTGKSDVSLKGSLNNFYGFLFNKETLKGDFTMFSNLLAVNDFMSTAGTTESTANTKTSTAKPVEKSVVKIPSFLDCTLTAKANTVIYDNINLKDASGTLVVRDQSVILKNLKSNLFGGAIALDGTMSTKSDVPTFDVSMGLDKLDIGQSFTQLDFLKKIAPIANVIVGKLNSKIKLSGSLKPGEFTPNLNTLSGDLVGELLSTSIKSADSKLLSTLDSKLSFIDLNKLNLKDLKTHLSFADGKVDIKPFNIKYDNVVVTIGGTHGFDQSLNYNLNFDVPAKYLGNEVGNLLSKLTETEVSKLQNVPVKALITGSFDAPKIATDTKQAVTSLTNQIVAAQKDKAVEKGKDALTNLIKGNSNSQPPQTAADSAKVKKNEEKVEQVKNAANAIKDLFKKK